MDKSTRPQAIVVCAAIRFGDIILAGARHWDSVMRTQRLTIGIKVLRSAGKEEQGFINQFGEFLDRYEAMALVKETGQKFNIKHNNGDSYLFSEGLY